MRIIPPPKSHREKYPYHRPAFIKKVVGVKTKRITAKYDSRKQFKLDPVGYFIIKVFYQKHRIGARFCTYDNVPRYDITGKNAEEVAMTIVRMKLTGNAMHLAYLGHELHKAETALKLRLNFVQDSPLDYSKRTKKKESDNLPE
jgi:hypothetical protein